MFVVLSTLYSIYFPFENSKIIREFIAYLYASIFASICASICLVHPNSIYFGNFSILFYIAMIYLR
jgi:hypothetical protein